MLPLFSRMFPGTNLQDLNLDWICRRIMELSKGIIAPWINPDTKTWMVYNTEEESFEDSGVSAEGSNNPLLGRIPAGTVSIIGDSISSYDGDFEIPGYRTWYPRGDVTDVSDMWWYRAVYAAGAAVLVNASYSASMVTDNADGRPDFYARVGEEVIGNPDTIIVALGTNDSINHVDLGNFDYTTAYTQLSETAFRPAYIKGIKALQALHPNAKIIALILSMTEEYKQSITSICSKLGVTCVEAGTYTVVSSVHPDKFGHASVASAFNTNCNLSCSPSMVNTADAVDILNYTLPTGEGEIWTSGTIKAAKFGKIVLVSMVGVGFSQNLNGWETAAGNLPAELLAPSDAMIATQEMASAEPVLTRKLRVRVSNGDLQFARGDVNATYTGEYIYMSK